MTQPAIPTDLLLRLLDRIPIEEHGVPWALQEAYTAGWAAAALPSWVTAVVRALARYEDEHPRLYAQYAGSEYQPADCVAAILELIPQEIRSVPPPAGPGSSRRAHDDVVCGPCREGRCGECTWDEHHPPYRCTHSCVTADLERLTEASSATLAADPGPVQGDGSTDAPGGAEAAVQAFIELDGGGYGTVEVAGVQVPQVASLSLTGRAGQLHTLTLGLRLDTTVVDGRVLLELDDATRRTLLAAGWLPPDDSAPAGYYRLLAANNPAAALVALPTVAAQRDQARTERDQALARVEVAEKALRAGGERVLKQLGQMVQERDAALARVAELERQLTHAQDRPRVTEGGP